MLTLQIGQCGNQIGEEFWHQLCFEHGIGPDGTSSQNNDNLKTFFYQTSNGNLVPKTIMLDLEPRVINGIMSSEYKNIFNPQNTYIHKDGGGAGNNWGRGYSLAQNIKEGLLDMIDHELDLSDRIDGFLLTHSIAGGTGSGMGSYILELIKEYFPKKFINTFSVFPFLDKSSDVVVQPYNSILSLKRLAIEADSVIVVDNTALTKIVKQSNNALLESNRLIGNVMSVITSCYRFPGPLDNDILGLITSLIPIPRCHFLSTSYTPIDNIDNSCPENILRKLFTPENIMISTKFKEGNYLAILDVIRGLNNIKGVRNDIFIKIERCLYKIKERGKVRFVKWNPASIQIALSNNSPLVNHPSGLMICNHTSINKIIEMCIEQFDQLYKKKAFLDNYRKENIFSSADGKGNFEEMEDAREECQIISDEYKKCERESYFSI